MRETKNKKGKKKPHSKDEKNKLIKEVKRIIEKTEVENRALGRILKENHD